MTSDLTELIQHARRLAAVKVFLALFVFAGAAHLAPYDLREFILVGWGIAAIPLVVFMAAADRTGIAVGIVATTYWFTIRYADDMGGPYAHGLTAGFPGVSALLCTCGLPLFLAYKRHQKKKSALPSSSPTPEQHEGTTRTE